MTSPRHLVITTAVLHGWNLAYDGRPDSTNVNYLVAPPPSKLWVLVDENPDSVNDAAFAVTMGPSPTRYVIKWQDVPAVYHGGGCGFSFADGHAEIKKWMDRRTLSLKSTPILDSAAQTGFLRDNYSLLSLADQICHILPVGSFPFPAARARERRTRGGNVVA